MFAALAAPISHCTLGKPRRVGVSRGWGGSVRRRCCSARLDDRTSAQSSGNDITWNNCAGVPTLGPSSSLRRNRSIPISTVYQVIGRLCSSARAVYIFFRILLRVVRRYTIRTRIAHDVISQSHFVFFDSFPRRDSHSTRTHDNIDRIVF